MYIYIYIYTHTHIYTYMICIQTESFELRQVFELRGSMFCHAASSETPLD